jgi:hypothetical protein
MPRREFLLYRYQCLLMRSDRYVLFDNVLWTATSSQINRWRKHTLGINSTDMGHLAQSKIPFIYNFSQVLSEQHNTLPIILMSLIRPWFQNHSTGEMRRPFPDSELHSQSFIARFLCAPRQLVLG